MNRRTKILLNKIKEFGADSAGVVSIDSSHIQDLLEDFLRLFPKTKSLISFAVALNRPALQSRNLPLLNYEYEGALERLRMISFRTTRYINSLGSEAVGTIPAFPMNLNNWAGKIWDISHKPIAVAAGLGTIGINRNVLHPKYGSFILLGTLLTDMEFTSYSKPLEKEVCIRCMICVRNCPVNALSKNGIDFLKCLNNSYRYFMPGFLDLIMDMREFKNAKEFSEKWTDDELLEIWQSLTYGGSYHCANCMVTCPAYLGEKYYEIKEDYERALRLPVKKEEEKSYVVGPEQEENIIQRLFRSSRRRKKVLVQRILPVTCRQAIELMPLTFNPNKARGIDATIQFNIIGSEPGNWYITIKDGICTVTRDTVENPTLTIEAPSDVWLKIARREMSGMTAFLLRKYKAKGDKKLLMNLSDLFK